MSDKKLELLEILETEFGVIKGEFPDDNTIISQDDYYISYDNNMIEIYFANHEDIDCPISYIQTSFNDTQDDLFKVGKSFAGKNHFVEDSSSFFDEMFPKLFSEAYWEMQLADYEIFSFDKRELHYIKVSDEDVHNTEPLCEVRVLNKPENSIELMKWKNNELIKNLTNDVFSSLNTRFPKFSTYLLANTTLNQNGIIENSEQKIKIK